MQLRDELTGLLGRGGAKSVMGQAIEKASAAGKKTCFLVFCLKDIIQINKSLGTDAGNAAIRKFTSRLSERLSGICVIARLEGLKFIAITLPYDQNNLPELCIEKIVKSAKEPFELDSRIVSLNVTCGYSVFPSDGKDIVSIYKNAETALLASENNNKVYSAYTNELRENLIKRLELEKEMKQAVENQCREFKLYFLPVVELNTGRMIGGEALMRWFSKSGRIPPKDFIPIAEQTGLIVPMSWWLIHECCRYGKILKNNDINCTISMNIPAQVMLHKNFLTTINEAIKAYGVSPASLAVEIVESTLSEDFERVNGVIRQLHKLGIQVSVDDFGTGLISLTNLCRLKIDRIKIDRSFINKINKSEDDNKLIKTIASLSKNMEMIITAEGVETDDQYEFLKRIGCDEIQGHFITPALPGSEFVEFIT